MDIRVAPTSITKLQADMLLVFAWQGKHDGEVVLGQFGQEINRALGAELTEMLLGEQFEASTGATFVHYTHKRVGATRAVVCGLGKNQIPDSFTLRQAVAAGARRAKQARVKTLAIGLESELASRFGPQEAGKAVVEAVMYADYEFNRHKSQEKQAKNQAIESLVILTSSGKLSSVSSGAQEGEIVAKSVLYARDLVNEPPSTTTPSYIADQARNIARSSDRKIKVTILGPVDMRRLGMNALLAIASGSLQEPRFIHLEYDGGRKKTVCLVGKGITFDTGGLSLKPSASMETMKLDMAGAAAILGVFKALVSLKPAIRVVGLICATENMPGPAAVKPGDIVTAMNGKSIEILNTDAEGRVVLADGLSYAAARVKPDVLVDVATLTGAVMVALGEEVAGLFSNNTSLCQDLLAAGRASGEHLWEMPLVDMYAKQLKSSVADVKNISGSRYGGAINGALFLREFVPEDVAWAHIDIAGPAFAEKDTHLSRYGGTGFGVSTLLSYLTSR